MLYLGVRQATAFLFRVESFVGEEFAGTPETDVVGLKNLAIHQRDVDIIAEAGTTGADGGFDSGFQKISTPNLV
jgi:hypothetical protein